MRKLLIISFDAVGDDAYDQLLQLPHFAHLAKRSQVHRGVQSVYLTNTYPVHTSVVTGFAPKHHGLVNNTFPFPARHPRWCYEARYIKAKTLWQAAAEKGLRTAAVMWPVTAGAKEIRYNIPELMIQPGQSQVLMNLRYGTKILQLHMLMKYGRLLHGAAQPALDFFTTACMAHILRKKAPDMALVHFTAYDTLCHHHGVGSPALQPAFAALDKNLGILLDAAKGRYDVLLFSDHAQLPAPNPLLPNAILAQRGHINMGKNGDYLPGGCFFECSGGSAFLHPGALSQSEQDELRAAVPLLEGFGRFLRPDEMDASGRAHLPFGFAAKPGWACLAYPSDEKANHGYPADYAHYRVFYLCCGEGFAPGLVEGGSLLELARHAAGVLGLAPAPPAICALYH